MYQVPYILTNKLPCSKLDKESKREYNLLMSTCVWETKPFIARRSPGISLVK